MILRQWIRSKSQRERSDKLSDARAGQLKTFTTLFTDLISISISLSPAYNHQLQLVDSKKRETLFFSQIRYRWSHLGRHAAVWRHAR